MPRKAAGRYAPSGLRNLGLSALVWLLFVLMVRLPWVIWMSGLIRLPRPEGSLGKVAPDMVRGFFIPRNFHFCDRCVTIGWGSNSGGSAYEYQQIAVGRERTESQRSFILRMSEASIWRLMPSCQDLAPAKPPNKSSRSAMPSYSFGILQTSWSTKARVSVRTLAPSPSRHSRSRIFRAIARPFRRAPGR